MHRCRAEFGEEDGLSAYRVSPEETERAAANTCLTMSTWLSWPTRWPSRP